MNDVAGSGLISKIRQSWLTHKDLTVKVVISLGILTYYSLSLINISPGSIDGPLAGKLREPTRFICEFFGWVQNWRLFGPEIRNRNFHTIGLIGYEDGTIGSWEPPRFNLLNFSEKYRKDKFHKWDQDCLPWDNYRDFWPGVARYVANLHYDPKNKPVWFMLLRSEADIPDPRTGPILDPTRMPAHYRLLNAFTYHFRPEDFK